MSQSLPERPSAEHLRRQAKDLLAAFRKGEPAAAQRFQEHLPAIAKNPGRIALHDAQSVIAREYGFPSWAKLLDHVEEVRAGLGISQEVADSFVEAAVSGQTGALKRLLDLYPELAGYNAATSLLCGNAQYVTDVNAEIGPKGWKPLDYVCFSQVHQVRPDLYPAMEGCARLLLDRGADPNEFHKFEGGGEESPMPVLYGACCISRHSGIAKLLLDRGADPNDGESIYHAAQQNQPDMLEMLVQGGADISSKHSVWGNTPLFFNAGHRRTDPQAKASLEGCRWLLEHGADPNVTSGERNSAPLHAACLSGNTPLVQLLLTFGADPNLSSTDGLTPYMIAVATGNTAAAEALREAGADTALSPTLQFLADSAAGLAPRASVNPAELSSQEASALCKAAEHGNYEAVRGLLDAGIDVATRGEEGATPLHWACFCGWSRIARLLLERGAPIDVRDGTFQATPLGWALEGMVWNPSTEGDYVPAIRALLEAGSDPAEVREYADSGEKESESLAEVLALL